MKKRWGVIAVLSALVAPLTAHAGDTAQEAKNKQLVLDMWQGVIVEASADAVLKYISPDYIQHNPTVAPGRDGIYNAVKKLHEDLQKPDAKPHTNKKLIHAFADGDLVALTWTQELPLPSDPTKTFVTGAFDMFRLKDGLVVEHWDNVRVE
jgi:predicted SnoaL-like aldol condensation-catalyzing enzyme